MTVTIIRDYFVTIVTKARVSYFREAFCSCWVDECGSQQIYVPSESDNQLSDTFW